MLYINRKLFSRADVTHHKVLILLKGHFTIYQIKPSSICMARQFQLVLAFLDTCKSVYSILPMVKSMHRNSELCNGFLGNSKDVELCCRDGCVISEFGNHINRIPIICVTRAESEI